ncbi:LysR family transcriptional regulator [Candidatus Odyssella thessalonicensis]|uniref:LysR family transcriptional regulator n=1 Tax=Candidatus Odyssella thessalonicensis TaxID=84647 RepID=UPI000225A9EF|nr:LysR family transcriptional regulator [Candidatus Odyssella thessalonicensis]
MERIPLGKLKLIYELGREKSITRAANKLNLSQSALSKAISALEEQMQTKIFDRIPGGMRLTPDGERLFIYARKVIEEHSAYERRFFDREDELLGDLKIVTTSYLGSQWLTSCLEGYILKNPQVHIKILIKSEDIHPSEADVAICTFIPHQPHLIQKPLFTAYTRLYASPRYLEKHGTPETSEDLNAHRLITYKGNHYTVYGSTNWLLNVGNKPGTSPRESFFEIESLHGLLNCALQGYGIIEFPDYSIVKKLGLVEVLPKLIGPEIKIYYTYPQSRATSKKIQSLYEYLRKKEK